MDKVTAWAPLRHTLNVLRQPICASAAAKIGAQIAADTEEPLPSRARAVPQRSNQRETYV